MDTSDELINGRCPLGHHEMLQKKGADWHGKYCSCQCYFCFLALDHVLQNRFGKTQSKLEIAE